mmetsp:Transcript_45301/g.91399  ORF Transcript_45301/g.91399 Transcript_45301/m.91399 type:complete len:100 (-) Transcript_45301:251-550(-)|eukprot:CAMPEP_0171691096 /NCGR_PEP_ID=MMETSP0991-20121206/5347_1 /TAXON_ID=483369 /ORGANISM="non described non described, Strain CCMP2098" /LENGTH=99 /DNA_ID=CAMNT_0012279283 /DNA_START=70 /DNA_END=369 /DNA_ORIENTATION=+
MSNLSQSQKSQQQEGHKANASGPECIQIAKALGRENIPASCEDYLRLVENQNAAWEGASFRDRVSGTNSAAKGESGYYKLQRRFTNNKVQNPWAKEGGK